LVSHIGATDHVIGVSGTAPDSKAVLRLIHSNNRGDSTYRLGSLTCLATLRETLAGNTYSECQYGQHGDNDFIHTNHSLVLILMSSKEPISKQEQSAQPCPNLLQRVLSCPNSLLKY
jgi:hypothetical protein